ncbi:DUF456 domain-containing protein [Candidatus Nanohalococcus occultus]|uniref:Uncharacterized membrane protein, DUF456 family n=1 Tax=Candidatus Nanohalococcus occultus TaxID=2978047 RepID=A0ABY8CHS6_9ARCH|nr:Uncharacterized membrane protein, DUF456 family [Candidatus Nanohaloarchaeota archaeon SVXNc]
MEPVTIAVIVLLIAGVVGSIVPMAPGALFSIIGVLLYMYESKEVSLLFSVFGLLTGLFALLTDWFAGSIAAKAGGASNTTSLMAGIAGVFGFIFLGGPIGLAIAVAATVFLREYLIHGDSNRSLKASAYSTLGVLGSALIQAMLTASILVAFLLTILI